MNEILNSIIEQTETTVPSSDVQRRFSWKQLPVATTARQLLELPDPRRGINQFAFGQMLTRSGMPAGIAKGFEYDEILDGTLRELADIDSEIEIVQRRWNDTGEIHGAVSPGYAPVDTKRLAAYVTERCQLAGVDYPVTAQYDNREGKLDSITIETFNSEDLIRDGGHRMIHEPVTGGFEITQGNVANRRLRIRLFLKILVCSNGMSVTEEEEIFSQVHRGSLRWELFSTLKAFDWTNVDSVTRAAQEFQQLAEQAKELEYSRSIMEQLLKAAPVTGESLPAPKPSEADLLDDVVKLTVWDVSQNINSSDRYAWATEGRADAADKARDWLKFATAYAIDPETGKTVEIQVAA